MLQIIFALAVNIGTSYAAEVSVPLKGLAVNQGDTVTFTERCDSKDIPLNQDGVKFELTGKEGRPGVVGRPWTEVRVSKGYESYEVKVVGSKDKDPIAQLKSGKYTLMASYGTTTDCTHTKKFKIYADEANAPCSTGAAPAGSTAPTTR